MMREISKNPSGRGKRMLSVAIAAFTLYGLAGTAMMILVLDMLEKMSGNDPVNLKPYWWTLVGLVVLKALCNIAADLAKHHAGFDIVAQLREKIVLRLKSFSLGFYTRERLGEISTIIHKDVDNMESVVAHMGSRLISDFLIALVVGAGLFLVDWRLGLAMTAPVPLALWLLFGGIRKGQSLQKKLYDDLADMVSLFVEFVKGIPLLKVFPQNKDIENRLKASAGAFGRTSQKMAKSTAGHLARYALFLDLGLVLLATAGAYLVFRNDLSIYDYLLFVIVSREFYKPFAEMEGHWINYIKVTDSYRRILTILNGPVVKTPDRPRRPQGFAITFDQVRFFYEKGEFELKNAAFHLEENTLTALVGPSGSGKTTITNLLLRFWDPQGGSISLGGADIRSMDYDHLLDQISIVMQNVILLADTIHNNILIGKRNATREQIIAAAKKAMIHEDIMALPQGYDTLVGENGVGLSGGQKQRISIARAFLKNAPIVILDEMTSNVDPVNEEKIQQAVSRLATGRTVLVIAHHLRTIRTADRILVFDQGTVVQSGTHDQLVARHGLYQSLWQSQNQAMTWQLARESQG